MLAGFWKGDTIEVNFKHTKGDGLVVEGSAVLSKQDARIVVPAKIRISCILYRSCCTHSVTGVTVSKPEFP